MEERGWWEQEHGCTWGLRGRPGGGGEWGGKKRRPRLRCPPHLASAAGHNFHLNNSLQPTFPCKLQSWGHCKDQGSPGAGLSPILQREVPQLRYTKNSMFSELALEATRTDLP